MSGREISHSSTVSVYLFFSPKYIWEAVRKKILSPVDAPRISSSASSSTTGIAGRLASRRAKFTDSVDIAICYQNEGFS